MDPLAAVDVALVRADNPGPFTLEGTNSWVVGRDPCWVVDPGPALDAHLDALAAAAADRGGPAGVVLTHGHGDHSDGVAGLLDRVGAVTVAAATWPGATQRVSGGDEIGPFRAVATPGHAPDHLAFVAGRVLFSGDAVLGRGSVYVAPDPGALSGYLAALDHLLTLDLDLICSGHGPLVTDPRAKLAEYLGHRLDRERRLLDALDAGARTTGELLDAAWVDVPDILRPAAAVTLAAHLDKLAEEGRLPAGVDRDLPARYGDI
jgi:glyoxylase-like metal-dependent hydrolase (beta-lactamase superfamily II)